MGTAATQARFFEKLAALLRANLPLLKAMEVALERVDDERLRAALSRILDRAYQGSSLTDAFDQEAEVFSTEVLTLIASGEETGDLEHKTQALAEGLAAGTFEPRPSEGAGAPPLELLIAAAKQAKATGVHVTPAGPGADVRFRIDGLLTPQDPLGAADLADLLERAHLLCGLSAEPVAAPRSGEFEVAGLRVAAGFCPLPEGESLVFRLTPPELNVPSLTDLGFSAGEIETLTGWSAWPNGILLIAGLPGSGRERAMRALVAGMECGTARVFAVTAGTMPEIPGVSRLSTDALAPGAALQAVLGQDLDVVMVDELRDPVAAEWTIRIARTGHLAITGIRAANAPDALSALLDLGFDPEDVAELVLGVAVLPVGEHAAEIFAVDHEACRAVLEGE